jgi:hypothetical protein
MIRASTKEIDMTNQIAAALANYAKVYKEYQILKGATFNIDVATQFAVEGLFSQAKRSPEDQAIWWINDEAACIQEAMDKRRAA